MSKQYCCDNTNSVAKTKAGLIRGILFDGIYNFRGVQYATAKRFHSPQPVAPWEGIADATSYGPICPILEHPQPGGEERIPHRFWVEDENCQSLNIWTPSLDASAKKPVIVWYHGGGYASGSSIEHIAYDGRNLSVFGDAVVVTVNHRLNIFGHLDLSSFGEEYKNSGNVGFEDLVASLQWIHDNIENFGGDPENVTIFGQSGGGGKVTSLGQIPASKGLYHKGIVMSGVFDGLETDNNATGEQIAYALMKELHIKDNNIKELEEVPTPLLIYAMNEVAFDLADQGLRVNWGPVVNDWYLGDPLKVGFSEQSKDIPTMIGTVLAEFGDIPTEKNKKDMTREENEAVVIAKYGEEAASRILPLFREAYPGMPESYACAVDIMSRPASLRYARQKSEDARTPVYCYLFSMPFDYLNGTPAWHCADIPLFFHNVDLVPLYQQTDVNLELQDMMAGALVNFARTGNPNGEGIPQWDPTTPAEANTLVFDVKSEQKCNYDDALLAEVAKHPVESPDFLQLPSRKNNAKKWVY